MLTDDEIKPCPFCGISLTANTNRADLYVRRYGTHYAHPIDNCFLSDAEVSPCQVKEWNRRAIEAATLASSSAAREDAWIPASERLPEPNVDCVVAWTCGNETRQAFASLSIPWKGIWLWHGHTGAHVDVTHWRPKPANPAIQDTARSATQGDGSDTSAGDRG